MDRKWLAVCTLWTRMNQEEKTLQPKAETSHFSLHPTCKIMQADQRTDLAKSLQFRQCVYVGVCACLCVCVEPACRRTSSTFGHIHIPRQEDLHQCQLLILHNTDETCSGMDTSESETWTLTHQLSTSARIRSSGAHLTSTPRARRACRPACLA